MNDSQQLRESMWDLVYGLLSDEESQALIARIKSDPDAARLYAEVRLEADLVARAARVEDSSIALSVEPKATTPVTEKSAPAVPATKRPAVGRSKSDLRRPDAWLAACGMTALAVLLAVGFFWPQPSQRQLAARFLATDLSCLQPMPAGLTNSISVRTYPVSFNGDATDGAPANVELRLLDRAGNQRLQKTVQTNEIGQATIELPGEALEPGARLELATVQLHSGHTATEQTAQISLKKAKQSAILAADLPVQPEPQMAYFLCAEPSPAADKETSYSIWNFSAFTAKPGQAEVGQVAVSAIQEATRGKTDPLATAQGGVVTGKLQVPKLEFADARSRAISDKSAQAEGAPALDAKQQTVLALDQPVPVAIPKQLEGKPLAITAMNRGVTVAAATVNSSSEAEKKADANAAKESKSAGQQISLAVPPEADGLIEVDLFDQSNKQNQRADRQYVYRQPRRGLRIDLPDVKDHYSPGQEVELTLRCSDENGKSAADTLLGVRVWNETAIQQLAEQPVLLADAVTQGVSEILEESGASQQRAAATESLLPQSYAYAQSPNAPPPISQPVELASNRDAVQAAFREAISKAENARRRALEALGGAAIIGGIAVLVIMAMLAVLRLTIGWRAMTPTLVVALASVLVGLGWIGWLPSSRFTGNIAMARASKAAQDDTVTASGEQRKDLADAAISRDREESTNAPREPAPSVASGLAEAPAVAPMPPAPMTAPLPTALTATPAEQLARQLSPSDANPSVVVGAPETVRQLVQSRQPAVNFQTFGGQQARGGNAQSFNLAKDEVAAAPARRLTEAAGAAGGFSAGRAMPTAGASATNEQVRLRAAAPAAAKAEPADRAAGKPGEAPAPSSLYFNPQLMTDADGKATIRFTMPPAEAEYRLLIDALGQGRIGSRQQAILCASSSSAK